MTETHWVRYRPDIDGLRAISILAVVIYHAFPTLLPGGFVGVDIFFVISGYLITSIILRSSEEGRFSLANFYRRRVQRIFPALALILAFCLATGWFVLLPGEYAALGKHTAAGALFTPNIVFWTEAGYFDVDSKLKPLLHLWSLGVEEQFYLVWPLLLGLALSRKIQPLWLIGTVLLASFAASIAWLSEPASAFFLPQFRVWELLLGALLAALVLRRDGILLTTPWSNALIGIALLATALTTIDRYSAFPGWWALLPTVGAGLLISAHPRTWLNRVVLGSTPMVLLGKISFPLYLWHWPLLSLLRIMEGEAPDYRLLLAAVALSVLLAWASYVLVEKRLRYHSSPATPMLLVTTMLVLAATGSAIYLTKGLPSRMPELASAATQFNRPDTDFNRQFECQRAYPEEVACRSSGINETVAIIGDSHAGNAFFALKEHYDKKQLAVVGLERPSCPPLLNVSNRVNHAADKCVAANRAAIEWLANQPDIHTVYLSSMGTHYLRAPRYEMRYTQLPDLQDHRDIFRRGLSDTVQTLHKAGKRVVLIIDWPTAPAAPQSCLNLRPVRLSPFAIANCEQQRTDYERRNRDYLDLVRDTANRFPELLIWDTPSALCKADICPTLHGQRSLYRDPGHLSLYGAQYLGQRHKLSTTSEFQAGSTR